MLLVPAEGQGGIVVKHLKLDAGGTEKDLLNVVRVALPDEFVKATLRAAGHGPLRERVSERMLKELLEEFEARERAQEIDHVALAGRAENETPAVDAVETVRLRVSIVKKTGVPI